MVTYKNSKQLVKAGFNVDMVNKRPLRVEEALMTGELLEELGQDVAGFAKEGDLFKVTIMEVVVDGWESKKGKSYPKGTVFILPRK